MTGFEVGNIRITELKNGDYMLHLNTLDSTRGVYCETKVLAEKMEKLFEDLFNDKRGVFL